MSARSASGRDAWLFLGVIVATVGGYLLLRPDEPAPPVRTGIAVPPDEALHPVEALFDLTPDGRTLVYRRQTPDGDSRLWLRPLPDGAASPVPATEGAGAPRVSPRGDEVAFVARESEGRLRVASLTGDSARTLVEGVPDGGVGWGPEGSWLYFTDRDGGIARVAEGGGPVETITETEPGEWHWAVEPLPDGRTVLYSVRFTDVDDPRIEVVDLATGERRDLWPGRYPRLAAGTLHFAAADAAVLMSAPIDLTVLDLTGRPTEIERGIAVANEWPLYAVDTTGSVVYGRSVGLPRAVPVWVDRSGAERPVDPSWSLTAHPTYSSVALAGNDADIAFSMPDSSGAWALWRRDTVPGAVPEQLTRDGRFNYRPSWRPDGISITYLSDRGGEADLWIHEPTGERMLLDRPTVVRNGLLSPDGAWILFREGEAPVADVLAVRSDDPSVVRRVAAGDAGERSPELSPDGRLVAYAARDDGEWQVWMRRFADAAGPPVLVSPDGGEEPRWSPAGGELFYRNWANELVTVSVGDSGEPTPGPPTRLFSTAPYLGSDGRAQFAVASDGARFLFFRVLPGGEVALTRIGVAGGSDGR